MDILIEKYNAFHDYQYSFQGDSVADVMKAHIEIPVFFVTFYLILIFCVPPLLKDRKPIACNPAFALWNFCLSTFSFIGSYYTIPVLIRAVYTHGLRWSACTVPDHFYYNGSCGFWVALFILSKIPELMDTVFLVIQKKDVIFLHWFHHVTVMLYCWHAYTTKTSSGLWFAAMNFGVHSIMYLYYFLSAIGARKLVRPFARSITSLQILQMIMGMLVTVLTFLWSSDEEGCHVDTANSRMGLAMYTSYFYLFSVLYYNLYMKPGGKHRAKKGGKEGAEEKTAKSLCNVEEVQDGAGQFLGSLDEKDDGQKKKKH